MTTLIIGGSGFLGRALYDVFGDRAHATYFSHPPATRAQTDSDWHPLDIGDAAAIESVIATIRPDLVINAAYVSGGSGLEAITARAPATIARVCQRASCRLVHVSTDVVFAGDRTEAYTEADDPDPVHAYGRAKLAAERAVGAIDPTALIVRTSLLYGGADEHAQEALVRRAVEHGDISFFTDEVRCPIAVADLAMAIRHLTDRAAAGVWHVAGPESLDRLSFAQLLAPSLGIDPTRLRGDQTAPDAIRPRHVTLDSSRALAAGVKIRTVREVVADN